MVSTSEHDLRVMCNKIGEVMRERLESVVGNTKEEMKVNMRTGMRELVEAVEEVIGCYLDRVKAVEIKLSSISESVQQVEGEVHEVSAVLGKESSERRDIERRTEERLTEVEVKVQQVRAEVDQESSERRDMEKRTVERLDNVEDKVQQIRAEVAKLTDIRNKIRIEESVKEMEAKVRLSMCMVKVSNINIGMITDNKATIVREVIGEVRKRARREETGYLNRILKRTRVIVLGKKTEKRQDRGRTEYTVPILFECQDRKDALELDRILRDAGYFPTFHWPSEIMEFIGKIREKVRKMGHTEQNSYVRIRPQVREGRLLLRADAKPKVGGRYVTKGNWLCPPLNTMLWEGIEGLFTPQIVGRGA